MTNEEIEQAAKNYAEVKHPINSGYSNGEKRIISLLKEDRILDFTNGANWHKSQFKWKKIDPENLPEGSCLLLDFFGITFHGYFADKKVHVFGIGSYELSKFSHYISESNLLKLDKE